MSDEEPERTHRVRIWIDAADRESMAAALGDVVREILTTGGEDITHEGWEYDYRYTLEAKEARVESGARPGTGTRKGRARRRVRSDE